MIPLNKIQTADTMQKYIDQHLTEDITLRTLADCTSYSPWHASRIFKEIVGMTPFEYVRKVRLSSAAVDLWDEEQKVLDIAIKYVFDSHEGFTRAFSKQFGLTPGQYKKQTPPLALFKPVSIRDHYRYKQGNDPLDDCGELSKTYFVQVLNFPKRKLIYYPCDKEAGDYFSYAEATGCDVWGLLCSIKEALYEPVGLWFPQELRPGGCSQYVQGVEVPAHFNKEIPASLSIIELPPCSMMIFQGAPFDNERYSEAVLYLSDEINKYDPMIYGYEWDDSVAPRIQLEPQGYRGYMEARPVKNLGNPQKQTREINSHRFP